MNPHATLLGAQLWLEPDMPTAEVERLVQQAQRGGLRALRLMLLWSLVERRPGERDFRVFDDAMAACERLGIGVWLTLGAESLPWHHGVPGMVQSSHEHMPSTTAERELRAELLRACVERYRDAVPRPGDARSCRGPVVSVGD